MRNNIQFDASSDFFRRACFSDGATLHESGVVNRYNCRIWGSQIPHITYEFEERQPQNGQQVDWTAFLFGRIRTWICWSCMRSPNYHLKLSSNKMGHRHISGTMLRIIWTERRLADGSAEVYQMLGLLGRQI
jgi:hypothetical protein